MDSYAFAQLLIESRQNVSPKRLAEPGPSRDQLEALLALASSAPDHGLLTPWRFVLVALEHRVRLAEVFAQALADRDPGARPEQLEAARQKAFRAPALLIAVACLGRREPDVPTLERMISMGAAIQNLLLGAHAMGFGAGLTSGRAMISRQMHLLCGLDEGDVPVCCINIGTVVQRKPPLRNRPPITEFFRDTLPSLRPDFPPDQTA